MPRPSFPSSGSVSGAITALGSQVIKSLSWNYGEAKTTTPNPCEVIIDSSANIGLIQQRGPSNQAWVDVGLAASRWFGAPVFSIGHQGFDLRANIDNSPDERKRVRIGIGTGFAELLGNPNLTAKWLGSRFRTAGEVAKRFSPTEPWQAGAFGNGAGPGVTVGAGRTALTVAAIRQERSDKIDYQQVDFILINAGTFPTSVWDALVYPSTTNPNDRWYYAANLGTVIWDAPSASFLQTQQVGNKTFLKSSPFYTVNFPSGSLTQNPMTDLLLPPTAEVECIASLPPAPSTANSVGVSSPTGLLAVNAATARASATMRLAGSATITANQAINDLYLWPISYTDKLNKLPNNY
jgi:hypothetical protein